MKTKIQEAIAHVSKLEADLKRSKADLKEILRNAITSRHPFGENVARIVAAVQSLENELNAVFGDRYIASKGATSLYANLDLSLELYFNDDYQIILDPFRDEEITARMVDSKKNSASFLLRLYVFDSNISEGSNELTCDYIKGDLSQPFSRESIIEGIPLLNVIFNEITSEEAGFKQAQAFRRFTEPMPLYVDNKLNLEKLLEIYEVFDKLSYQLTFSQY